MKKGLVWALVLLAAVLLETAQLPSADVAELSPVTLLTVAKTGDIICVRSDTGDAGYGRTLETALSDLQQTSEKTLFFETAQSMVFDTSAAICIAEAAQSKNLRPATKVYLAGEELPPAKDAAGFLKMHAADATLGKLRAKLLRQEEIRLPVVLYRNGRMYLVQQHD